MSSSNSDQKAFWEKSAQKWVTRQSELDAVLEPVLDLLLEQARLAPGQQVLDVGCGTGSSTRRAARAVAPDGIVTGIDISEPMLARARALADDQAGLRFLCADAAEHEFPHAHFDAVISRFGTMFFTDPVAAFDRLRRAMRPTAQITMVTWSGLAANPWFRVPVEAATAHFGPLPPMDPHAPGPLAFSDIARVCQLLSQAGFHAAVGRPVTLSLAPCGTLPRVADLASDVGPVSRAMDHFDGTRADHAAITAAVEKAFEQYLTPDGVKVPAEINVFTAHAPLAT